MPLVVIYSSLRWNFNIFQNFDKLAPMIGICQIYDHDDMMFFLWVHKVMFENK